MGAEAARIAEETADEPDDPDEDAALWRRLVAVARGDLPAARVEHALHPWTSYVVLPIFALANAGIVARRGRSRPPPRPRVALAVVLGLVVGKTSASRPASPLAVRLG